MARGAQVDGTERDVGGAPGTRVRPPARVPEVLGGLAALQRSAGNAAVSALLAGREPGPPAVQRTRIDLDGAAVPGSAEEDAPAFQQAVIRDLYPARGVPVLTTLYEAFSALPARTPWDEAQRRWLERTIHQVYGTVVSGHGALNTTLISEKRPVEGTRRRNLGTTFTMPANVHLVFYLPDGALLEQRVANAIETGNPPSAADVHLVVNGGTTKKQVPTPYPEVVGPGEQAENYAVSPPLGLTVRGAAITVQENTLLSELVGRVSQAGGGIVRFACCKRTLPGRRDWTGFLLEFTS